MKFRIFFDDVHGTPEYRKHMTFYFAEEIRRELSGKVRSRELSWSTVRLFRKSHGPGSACELFCARWDGSESKKVATPATAAPARSGSTASRCIAA